MENEIYILVSITDGWVSPFYFTSFESASRRVDKEFTQSSGRFRFKVVKLKQSCFDHEY